MKSCYTKVFEDTVKKLNNYPGCFRFAVAADSHLDNSMADTCENIRKVSESAPLSCVLHLGDIMCDGVPRKALNTLLKREIALWRTSLKSGLFFPTRGNHDGFKNLAKGKSVSRLDEDWCDATWYIEDVCGTSRPDKKPYYYVDFSEKKIRFISLDSFSSIAGYDDSQLEWFKNDALMVDSDWTVIAFSHDAPIKSFDENYAQDNPVYNGIAMLDAIKECRKERGFDFAAWLIGHYHGDFDYCIDGINLVLVASETAYVPTLWSMPEGGYFPDRVLGTSTEDLWDAVCIDKDARTLRFFRFGAGKDRKITY